MEPEILSKTRRKARMHELQVLGEAMVALPRERLEWLDLPRELAAALAEARRLAGQFEAYRRQMQYVGRLLQAYELEALKNLIEALRPGGLMDARHQREAEQLAEAFLADESLLGELLSRFPDSDAPHWRQLRRQALRGRATEPADAAPFRRLVSELRGAIEAHLRLPLPQRHDALQDHEGELLR
ncbi:ribosome biogenesis factor YjgA [Hydrogenophilus islandicus]